MNRFVKYEGVTIKLGKLKANEMVVNSASIFDDRLTVSVLDKYFDLNDNCYITCDLMITHGILKDKFELKRKDLYYLNSDKETISKEDILKIIIDSGIIKTIIVENRVDIE